MDLISKRLFIALILSLLLTTLSYTAILIRRLLYKLKFPRKVKGLNFLGLITQKVAAEHPDFEWTPIEFKIDQKKEELFCPVWNCWPIFQHPDILDGLLMLFRTRFDPYIDRNTKICAINQPSLFFLGKLDDWIQNRGAMVLPFDEHYPIIESWKTSKLVLFDMNLNTGKTMGNVSQYFVKLNWKPAHYLVLLYNNFLPTNGYFAHAPNWPKDLSYIYKASTVAANWDRQDLAKSLLIVKDAIANRRSWSDSDVIESVELLRKDPVKV
jgi:hypothetical protein